MKLLGDSLSLFYWLQKKVVEGVDPLMVEYWKVQLWSAVCMRALLECNLVVRVY